MQERTGATAEEAQAVIARLDESARRNGTPIGVMGRYVEGCATEDLERHLAAVRRDAEAAARPRVPAQRAECERHPGNSVPCGPCAGELFAGGAEADQVRALLARVGTQARPDLAANPRIGAVPASA